MEQSEVDKIIEEGFAADPSGGSIWKIQRHLALNILNAQYRQFLSAEGWEIFILTLETEMAVKAFSRVADNASTLGMKQETVNALLGLYDKARRLCDFLIDDKQNGRAPISFWNYWDKEALTQRRRTFCSVRDRIANDFKVKKSFVFRSNDFPVIIDLIYWVRVFLLGEERCQFFMGEMSDAINIAKTHSRHGSAFRDM